MDHRRTMSEDGDGETLVSMGRSPNFNPAETVRMPPHHANTLSFQSDEEADPELESPISTHKYPPPPSLSRSTPPSPRRSGLVPANNGRRLRHIQSAPPVKAHRSRRGVHRHRSVDSENPPSAFSQFHRFDFEDDYSNHSHSSSRSRVSITHFDPAGVFQLARRLSMQDTKQVSLVGDDGAFWYLLALMFFLDCGTSDGSFVEKKIADTDLGDNSDPQKETLDLETVLRDVLKRFGVQPCFSFLSKTNKPKGARKTTSSIALWVSCSRISRFPCMLWGLLYSQPFYRFSIRCKSYLHSSMS